MFKNGSFLSPCVCDTLRFESPPLRGKKIEFGTDSLLLPRADYDIELPECQERGAKTKYSVFLRTRLMPTFGVSAALSVEHCQP